MRHLSFVLFFCLIVCHQAHAEIVKLKSGRVIDGVIVEKRDDAIKVEHGGGIEEFQNADIRYIKGEGLDRASAEYYGLLLDAMNEADTTLEGKEVLATIRLTVTKDAAAEAFEAGVACSDKGLWDEGIGHFTTAIDGGFNLAEAYYGRGYAHYQKKEFEKAIADFNGSLREQPNDPLTLASRGDCYRKLGKREQALDDLSASITLNKNDDVAWANRAHTYFDMGATDQAIADLTVAMTLNPADPLYYANRGQFYVVLEDYGKALKDMKKAESLGWKDEHGIIAQVVEAQGATVESP